MVESRDLALAALDVVRADLPSRPRALVVPIRTSVPDWLPQVVQEATSLSVPVDLSIEPDDLAICGDPGTEQRDGWEIGVITAALSVGVRDVLGADPRRVARVRAVLGHLAEAAAAATAVTAEVVS